MPSPSEDAPLDMELLRRRMADLLSSSSSSESVLDLSSMKHGQIPSDSDDNLPSSDPIVETFKNLSSVWVILFTNASDGSDGVYSLSVAEENIVLAFEARDEAHRYAMCLELQDFPSPQLCELDADEVHQFCMEEGFRLGFVPMGSVVTPPEESAIDDMEQWRGEPSSPRADKDALGMSEEDLEAMRKRFDTLFGQ